MVMRWYVVHAYSGYEKKVAAALQDRIELHGLKDRFGEILVPTEEVVEMKETSSIRSPPSIRKCSFFLTLFFLV